MGQSGHHCNWHKSKVQCTSNPQVVTVFPCGPMGWQPGKSNRGHANWPVFSCNDETDYDTSRQVEGIEIDLFFLCKDEAVLHTRRRLAAVMLKRVIKEVYQSQFTAYMSFVEQCQP
eukprot:scaffold20134_cov18-Tisochrysis_lutea.AAC.1